MNRTRPRSFAALLASVLIAACSGGSSSTAPPTSAAVVPTLAPPSSAVPSTTVVNTNAIDFPLGIAAIEIARMSAEQARIGDDDTEPIVRQLTTGSTLTTITVGQRYNGRPIAGATQVVIVAANGDVLDLGGDRDPAVAWDEVRRLDGAIVDAERGLVALGQTLDRNDLVLEESEAVWVPVATGLREGWRLVARTPEGSQRMEALFDSTTLSITDVVPLVTEHAGSPCPVPGDLDPPATCVGGPTSAIASLSRPIEGTR